MERREPTQKALVLAGGGARGSYQVGVWRALMELDWHPQIITGTSVGGLNGAMFVLDLYETARDMWLTIRSRDVMELPKENADLSALHQFLRRVVKEGGMDVTPLEEIVERVLDEDALRAAPIRLGIVTVEQRGLRPRELTLEDIPAGQVRDYLMASAACFPALRARQIDGVKFLDGGYSDNMPTGLAKTMGAEELVCVDLEGVGITRPNLTGLPTTMIRSYWELGDILHFDPDTDAIWSWATTTPCAPLDASGAVPTRWTAVRTAAPMPKPSAQPLTPCRRRCGRSTPSPLPPMPLYCWHG